MLTYSRLYLMLSLIAILLITAVGGMYFNSAATESLVALTDKNNINISQSYISSVWKNYRQDIVNVPVDQLSKNPRIAEFAQQTIHYFQPFAILRVNIYNAQGLLLMTAGDSKPSGGAATPDPSYISRRLVHLDVGSRVLQNAQLGDYAYLAVMQTVVPIVAEGRYGNEAVVEILYDMSVPWATIDQRVKTGTGVVIGMFAVMLLFQFIAAQKSESIIAKQHEANQDLAAAAAAAQAENRDKSQFLANVSHELRTPLNAIIGFSEIIKNEVIPLIENKKYHDYIGDINSSGVHLLSLINDILDYSKAEAGKLELESSEVNLTKVIQNSMRMMGPRAATAKVTLEETLPKEPIIIITDGKKFKQIMLNLLSNSVKFTPVGGKVTINAWRNVADDGYAFEVTDTGIGIAAKDISRAMAPFGQVDHAHSRKYEGTGLGLPLTKKFVELMGGKFTIKSEVDVGTTVIFTLPRELTEREGVVIKQMS